MYLIATTALYVMLEVLDYTADFEWMFQTFHNRLQLFCNGAGVTVIIVFLPTRD